MNVNDLVRKVKKLGINVTQNSNSISLEKNGQSLSVPLTSKQSVVLSDIEKIIRFFGLKNLL